VLGNIFARSLSGTLTRPKPVLAVCLALTLGAVWLGSSVEFRTSRSELAPADDPDQLRWEALLRDYKTSETVIVCVEAAPGASKTGDELERFTDLLAGRIAGDPVIERVFHRFDVAWVMRHGLYLMPPEARRDVATTVAREWDFIAELASSADLPELNRRIAGRMEHGFAGTSVPPEAERAVSVLRAYLRSQRTFLEDAGAAVGRWVERGAAQALAGDRAAHLANGYMKTHDGKTLFVLVTPRTTDDSLPARRALLARLRDHVASVSASRPGIHVAFTGTPAVTVEEMDTVRRDTWRTSAVAVVGVILLTLLVFRWKTHALLVLLALAAGVAWSFGAVRLELGHLNLITSAFISTLVGVGVAYGIHPVSEYELEGAHTGDVVATVRESYRRTGPAIAAAGGTTAVAFLSILLMRFRGFAELGLVAGVGVVLCLISAMVCLPAILVVYGRWRRNRDTERRDSPRPLDRLWLERMAGRVCRFPKTTTCLAIAVTGWLGWVATGLTFDSNILELLPRDAESVRYQRRVALESDLSPVFNLVVAEDFRELGAMRARARREPAIARFESALRFLPEEPVEAREMLTDWRRLLDGLRLPPAPRPIRPPDLLASLRGLEDVLARSADAAFAAGLGDIAGPLEEARAEAERCAEVVAAAPAGAVSEWNDGQQALMRWRDEILAFLGEATRAEPPSPDNLPEELRERFFTRTGKPLAFLFPSGSVFDPDELERYVGASLRVSDDALGFPFMFLKMSNRITTGFYRAVILGAVLVFVILLIDLRNLRHAVLAAAPLAIGVIWALGAMRLLGLSFNFANLVAMPLIVGVGIDNGVHVVHRVRLEGSAGMDVVLRHTGRAILISSLTTMIGFGSLSLASHRGLESLGVLLLLGVASCLVASIVVLPNLLVVLGQVRARRRSAAGRGI
jgi:hopanoid biosynthesis associated RND transporter like protein HpnN